MLPKLRVARDALSDVVGVGLEVEVGLRVAIGVAVMATVAITVGVGVRTMV
jgi:hypothetical protein